MIKNFREIIDSSNIGAVIGDFISLKHSGSNLKGVCPFHNERSPSFMVSPQKGIYKCFGCGAHGDSVKFLMEYEQISFSQAVRYIAETHNIPIEYEQTYTFDNKEKLYHANNVAQRIFYSSWNEAGVNYMKSRGISGVTARNFGLGQSAPIVSKAAEYFAMPEDLKRAGLLNDNGGDFFRNRVLFPIFAESGSVAGFGGRTLDGNEIKYLNTRETDVFKKDTLLYGLYHNRKAIRQKNVALLVEGYLDVLTLHQNGIDFAVAPCGTSLSEAQAKKIYRIADRVVICFDGDNAGKAATDKAIETCLSVGLDVDIVRLPDGLDPDEYVRQYGIQSYIDYVKNNKMNFLQYKAREYHSAAIENKTAVAIEIAKYIKSIGEPIKCAVWAKEASNNLGLPEDIFEYKVITIELPKATVYKPIEDRLFPHEDNQIVQRYELHKWFTINEANQRRLKVAVENKDGEEVGKRLMMQLFIEWAINVYVFKLKNNLD